MEDTVISTASKALAPVPALMEQVVAIVEQPLSQLVLPGGDLVLSVTATGNPAPSYRWALNGDYIPNANESTLVLRNVQPVDGGAYSVTVLNELGAVDSDVATVVVEAPLLDFADNFADRGMISTFQGSGRASNAGASKESHEPVITGKKGKRSVWLSWIAPADGVATITTGGSTFDTLLAVYVGSALNALTPVASDDDSEGYKTSMVQFNAQAGVAYEIVVDGLDKAEGQIVLNWSLIPTESTLPIIYAGPQNATVGLGDYTQMSVIYDSAEPVSVQWFFNGQPIPGANHWLLEFVSVQPEQVGQYKAVLAQGPISLATQPAELQVNTEGVSEALAQNKEADATDSGLNSATLQSATLQTPVRRLALSSARRELQDLAPVRGYSGTQIFSTSPGKDPGEPNHCGLTGGASYWLAYQAPASGVLSLNTDGSSFDTILAVYVDDGRNLGYESLQSVACDNNGGANGKTSKVSFNVTPGINYYVVVDGVYGACGKVYLNYSLACTSTVNNPPVASTDTVTRQAYCSVMISVPLVLSNDKDPNGDKVSLAGVNSKSYRGAQVTYNSSYIYYYPPVNSNTTDYITYTVSDGKGGAATGRIMVYVTYPSYSTPSAATY